MKCPLDKTGLPLCARESFVWLSGFCNLQGCTRAQGQGEGHPKGQRPPEDIRHRFAISKPFTASQNVMCTREAVTT
jgi:hypothetical protein